MRAGAATIVLDGDQTLWDFQSAMVRALGETRLEIARVIDVDLADVPSIEELIARRDRIADTARGETLEAIRRSAFAETLAMLGHDGDDGEVDRVATFFTGRRFELCRPYHDTVPALTKLRESYVVALLTNGNSHPERMGLRSMFDHIFIAEELGAEKPDPSVYARVAATCGGEGALGSVGDSLMNDVVAPQKAGWKAVWINRDHRPLPQQVNPDASLTSLEGLDIALRSILA